MQEPSFAAQAETFVRDCIKGYSDLEAEKQQLCTELHEKNTELANERERRQQAEAGRVAYELKMDALFDQHYTESAQRENEFQNQLDRVRRRAKRWRRRFQQERVENDRLRIDLAGYKARDEYLSP